MKSYLIKNKKYTFMIIFFICFFFCIGKVDALVYKGYYYNSSLDNSTKSNFFSSTAYFSVSMSNNRLVKGDNDIYAFRFIKFNLVTNTYKNNQTYESYCTKWYLNPSQGSSQDLICVQYSSNQLNDSYIPDYNITVSVIAYDDRNRGEFCYFSNDYEGYVLCPLKTNNNIDRIDFNINATSGFPSTNFYYDIQVDKLVSLFNYDSTDIVNALSNIGFIQQNTTTTIQNFNNYVSDNNTTQAQTNQTTALGGMNSEFGSHLSQMNELTQLTMLPITFINSLLTNTCEPLVWDIPFVNSRVVVPCMSTIYNGYFSALVSTFSLIMTALLGYRAFIRLFNAIKGIVDAEDDKLEVVDL